MTLLNALSLGLLFCFLAIASGAFGAHGLKSHIGPEAIQLWTTGAQYQFYHGLALVALGLWAKHSGQSDFWPLICFTLGIFLFSGSLYLLALTGIKVWGMLTPIGGLFFLAGWAVWLVRSLKS